MALSNSQYNAIMREYERLQAESRSELRARKEKIYAAVPKLRALELQAGTSAMERFRTALKTGNRAAVEGFSGELRDLEAERRRLLAEAGYPADALEPRFRCPDCRDTGMADGQRCHCFKARAAELLYSQSGLRRILEHENFDRFSLELYDDQRVITKVGMTERAYMEKQLERCRRYAAGFREKRGNLLFRGNTGVGKSFLSHCIAKELIDQGFAVLYLGAAELFECMAAVSMDREEDLSRKEQYDLIFSADLLIIDDLGTEMMNSLTISQFFNLLNARDVPEKGTVISTNLSLTMLRDTYTERITSRILSGYSIIELYGDDLRRKI